MPNDELDQELQWLEQQAAELHIPLQPVHLDQFRHLLLALASWNERMNLTAIRTWPEMVEKHILDSMLFLAHTRWPQGRRVCDLGTGAGFPGLVLAILFQEAEFFLLDGTRKKLQFVDQMIRELELHNCRTLHGRAEEIARHADFRETFSIVVSRAMAAMPFLVETSMPLLSLGGFLIAWKGPNYAEELPRHPDAWKRLGAGKVDIYCGTLPRRQEARTWIVVEKVAPTPPHYPRALSKMKKAPIL